MINRRIYNEILVSLKQFPVVGIIGSRQVGKTTLAKEIKTDYKNSIYLDLELPSDYNKLEEAEIYLQDNADKLIIIDEVQRKKDLFPLLKALVDKKRVAGRFLILGSASQELIRNSSETLAGRINYHILSSLSIDEIGFSDEKINDLWIRGGYPLSYLAKSNYESLVWRDAFIKTYLEQDLPQLGFRIQANQIRKFWTMIAHLHSRIWNASQVAKSMGLSYQSINHYLNILNNTFIIRQLSPYHINIKKRLVKAPKVYIRDSGLLHSLINIQNKEALSSHPILGYSWEGFVIEQILNVLPKFSSPYFYRTHAGAEIDLVIGSGNEKLIAIEIKYSLNPKIGKGFQIAFNDLGCEEGFVVYPGHENYRISENVSVISLPEVLKRITNITKA
ncbi:MAG: ATP-binding protein [Bacteroidetes bacterium]|nr:ATP-binding protein [Bacteroidota bacterium]MBU1678976.1 ATP-binding protein [Bacteroidota bacterium]MBU2507301.1 ATP-binding protein [Bacteroidota bacterium]